MNGPNTLECCYIALNLERLANSQHSSLLGTFARYEENDVCEYDPSFVMYLQGWEEPAQVEHHSIASFLG
jgi:hypothetical protein